MNRKIVENIAVTLSESWNTILENIQENQEEISVDEAMSALGIFLYMVSFNQDNGMCAHDFLGLLNMAFTHAYDANDIENEDSDDDDIFNTSYEEN